MSPAKVLLRSAISVVALALATSPAAATDLDFHAEPSAAGCRPSATAPPVVPARTPGVTSIDASPDPDASPEPCSADGLEPPEDEAVVLTVEAGDLWFGPDELTISSQGQTTITLVDVGYAVHNLAVDELDLLVVATPGRSAQVTIADPEPGTYVFYCSVSGHREAGMAGTLTVE
ncbi:MAG: cupredoxin domain-containing protein [Candidatus Limnocylindrales bacterium]